jgi:transposase
MLGQKERVCKVHPTLCLEDLVPQNHFYRRLEAKLDLSFVRELVAKDYAVRKGRPSIDPVVFFKLQLIMFFEGIRSERQLMTEVTVNLAHRWYLGYDLDEALPNHSSLSKIRDRYGLVVFERFFEEIVERCRHAGLVWGEELYFDGTKVRANADIDKQVPRFYAEAKAHLKAMFADTEEPLASRGLVNTYNGQRLLGSHSNVAIERKGDRWVCPTDPDATPLHSEFGQGRLGYHVHYVVDGGKARIILAALVTPASIMDNTPMLDLARWVRFRWQIHPRIAVGDAKFGTIPNIVGLERDGIQAYLAMPDFKKRFGLYPQERFQYDAERDGYRCPQGHFLALSSYDRHTDAFMYRTLRHICNACPVKAECTTSVYGRIVRRSIFQTYLDRVQAYHQTPAYHKAMRKRSVWIEPLFGEAKQWHQLVQFRLRRLTKVNIQALLVAAGQNIKRLLQPKQDSRPLRPVQAAVLTIPFTKSSFLFCPTKSG